MKITALDYLLWALGFFLTAALLAVLLWRARWRQFPVFTLWIAFQTALAIALFVLYEHGARKWYSRVYWTSLWPAFILQLGVVLEIARVVLRPTGTWIRDARGLFIAVGFGGAAVAAALSWWITPPHGAYTAWELRGDLFTSLVICELFVGMSFTANRLGLGWRSHVMALGQGLTVWASASVVTNALESYFGTVHFARLEYLQGVAWIAANLWIATRLWIPEPERQPISEHLQKYILALHERVQYDLRRLGADR
jgi:cell division protein FtsW (lipid II flippase)